MFNAVLIQSAREGEILTAALRGAGETSPQHLLLKQCLEVAQEFLADANAVIRSANTMSLFGPLGTDRSGDRW